MQDLIKQEQFELEVLDRLNSGRLLSGLIFTGGTMLRLCFGLNRYSVDLDFWTLKGFDKTNLFNNLKNYLESYYHLKDAANKFYTLLFELRSKDYPRALKIEIRKEPREVATEQAIAYSKYSNKQVLTNVVTLPGMMKAKINTFLDRNEIRDAFDIEFLLKKGVELNAPPDTLKKLLKNIDSLKNNDYKVKLASILEEKQRKYYINNNFKILKASIKENIS